MDHKSFSEWFVPLVNDYVENSRKERHRNGIYFTDDGGARRAARAKAEKERKGRRGKK